MLKNTNKIDGWLVIDKPLNMGSTQVVSRLKHVLSPTRIGHAGTLDPLATGVLPIAFGLATKLIPYVMDGRKTYEFQVTWGRETETDDAAGNVTVMSDNRPTESDVRAVLPEFIGDIQQLPPAYSALKVQGRRAYDLARAGADVSLSLRTVRIDDLVLLGTGPGTADFRVVCGKGTYVRSLGRDLGRRLGCLGYITRLRRTVCGPFKLADATDWTLFDSPSPTVSFLPADLALDSLPRANLSEILARRLSMGQRLPLREVQSLLTRFVAEEDVVCLYLENTLIGLGYIRAGVLHPYRMFSSGNKS